MDEKLMLAVLFSLPLPLRGFLMWQVVSIAYMANLRRAFFMSKFSAKKIAMLGLFIALQIVFTRIFSIQLPTIRIGFTFIPLAMCSIIYGPLAGGIAAAAADLIGIALFPMGAFFPGFTLTAFLTGAVYGLFMHNKEYSVLNATLSVIVVCVFINLGLDTLWLHLMYDKGFFAILPGRIIKNVIMIPIQIPLILFFWKHFVLRFKESFA